MNSSRRWLGVFAVIIGILVIATVSLVLFNNGKKVTLLPEDAPQGIVQRYLIAIWNGDYQQADKLFSLRALMVPLSSILPSGNMIIVSKASRSNLSE